MSHSTFRRFPRIKQIENFLIEEENHIQSIGDTPIVEQILLQSSTNDYLYIIYLLILIICYIYYLTIILQDKSNLFDHHEEYSYFDNYHREIPRLLWFKKGYRFY